LRERRYRIHVFSTSALVRSEWLASHSGRFTPWEKTSTRWIGGWVGPQSRSRRRGNGKNVASTGTRTPNPRPSSPYPVAIPTELHRLPTLLFYDSSVGLAACYSLDARGSIPYKSRPALGLTKLRTQRVPGVRRPGRQADHSPPSNAEVKNGGAVLPHPYTPSWRCAKLSTGTTLPSPYAFCWCD
jgi:hypothetical protein